MKFLEAIACFTLTLVIGALLAVVLLEWAAGCGESYTDSQGVTHLNECLLINFTGDSHAND